MSGLRSIVGALHEAFNARRFDDLEKLFDENVRFFVGGQQLRGRSAIIEYLYDARRIGGMRLVLDTVLAETADTIVCRTRVSPVSAGIAAASASSADGQSHSVGEVYRIAWGRIIEAWVFTDSDSVTTARLVAEESALLRVAKLVARGAENQQVFDQVTTEASRLLDDAPTMLCRYERSGREVKILARNFPADAEHQEAYYTVGASLPVPQGSGRWRLWHTGRAVRIDSYAQVADIGTVAVGIVGSVVAPITVEGRLWGGLLAGSQGPPLPADTEERLSQFADLVAAAIANTQNRAELMASRARVVAGADEARRRLARDVHDGAQRRLVHALIAIKQARAALSGEDDAAAARLVEETLRQTQGAYDELRQLAQGILPAALEHGGLRTAVDELVADVPLAVRPRSSMRACPKQWRPPPISWCPKR